MFRWGIGLLFFCEFVFRETDGEDGVSGNTGAQEVRGWVRVLTRGANGACGAGRRSRSFKSFGVSYQLPKAIPETFVGITRHLVVMADKVLFF